MFFKIRIFSTFIFFATLCLLPMVLGFKTQESSDLIDLELETFKALYGFDFNVSQKILATQIHQMASFMRLLDKVGLIDYFVLVFSRVGFTLICSYKECLCLFAVGFILALYINEMKRVNFSYPYFEKLTCTLILKIVSITLGILLLQLYIQSATLLPIVVLIHALLVGIKLGFLCFH